MEWLLGSGGSVASDRRRGMERSSLKWTMVGAIACSASRNCLNVPMEGSVSLSATSMTGVVSAEKNTWSVQTPDEWELVELDVM